MTSNPRRRVANWRFGSVLLFVLMNIGFLAMTLAADTAEVGAENTQIDYTQIILTNGVRFKLEGPSRPEDIETFGQLTDEQRFRFYENRYLMLRGMAVTLTANGRMGIEVVQKVLNSLNQVLLPRAQVLVNSNEFGGIVGLSIQGGAAVRGHGEYLSGSLGMAVGYDRRSKQTTIEIIQDLETLAQAFPVVAQVGLGFKVMAYFSTGDRPMYQKGMSLSPPPFFSANDAPGTVAVGISAAPLSFPPGADFFYLYSSHIRRLSLVRMSIPAPGSKEKLKIRLGFRELYNLARDAYVEALTNYRSPMICLNILSNQTPWR